MKGAILEREPSTWKTFFDAHAPVYDDIVFTKNTIPEVDFLIDLSRSLKPNAKSLFTVLNAAAMLRRYTNQEVVDGRFDPMTLVESSEYPPQEGLPPVPVRERGFVPTELRLLFRLAGLSVLHMWGGTAGNWGRRPLDLDEIEIMIVARKTGEPSDALEAWQRA